jgi:hypothetical protein
MPGSELRTFFTGLANRTLRVVYGENCKKPGGSNPPHTGLGRLPKSVLSVRQPGVA